MNVETLNLTTSRGATTAYVARPHTEVDAGVILIQEYWGINDHIRDLAGRYANEGYLCVAPDLYRGRVAADVAEASALMQALAWRRPKYWSAGLCPAIAGLNAGLNGRFM